tara:strand:+ start:382 stop:573 length:192 start_codon:yes stop_codon:yes gene_type:complete
MENDKKKKFDPLATDWLMGNVSKEEGEKAEEVENTSEETTEDKVNEDVVEFKNILEDDEEDEE